MEECYPIESGYANTAIVVDKRFFEKEDDELVSSITEALRKRIEKSCYITFRESMENLGKLRRVIIIAHHSSSLEEELERIGRNNGFKDRFLVLATCGEHNSSELADRTFRKYHVSGVMWFPEIIHLDAVNLMINKVISIIEWDPYLIIDDVVKESVRRVNDSETEQEMKNKLEKLKRCFSRFS